MKIIKFDIPMFHYNHVITKYINWNLELLSMK